MQRKTATFRAALLKGTSLQNTPVKRTAYFLVWTEIPPSDKRLAIYVPDINPLKNNNSHTNLI
jgi:hypothetical protein